MNMNNTTVFDITKVSIEYYDAKTKKKEWNHLSNNNRNVFYEMKVTIEQSDLIFQIYNKADKLDMQMNLKVKLQKSTSTGQVFVSPNTLRMIIKPPIIAFRYNIKDSLNNEIVLKKAQFGIVNDLSFETMINMLVEKGVTLKDSKNKDYKPTFPSSANYESVYNDFENQILDSQIPDLNFNTSTPIEHPKPKKLSTLQENMYEVDQEDISYGNKQQAQSSSPTVNNFRKNNAFQSKNNNQYAGRDDIRSYNMSNKETNHASQQNYYNNDSYQTYQNQQNQSTSKDPSGYLMINNNNHPPNNEFGSIKQSQEMYSRRNSFYEMPMEQVYNRQRRDSILVPFIPPNDKPGIVYSDKKVMEKEDIEDMMTNVLNNVLPKISELQKPAEIPKAIEENKSSDPIVIDASPVVNNANGLSIEFFLCLDNQTKLGILKNLGFLQALKFLSKCNLDVQQAIMALLGKEVALPNGFNKILDKKSDLIPNSIFDYDVDNDNTSAEPKKVSSKTSKTSRSKSSAERRASIDPEKLMKELETWKPINENTLIGNVVGNKLLRRPRGVLPLAKIIENDADGEITVSNGSYKPQANAQPQKNRIAKPKISKKLVHNGSVDTIKQRLLEFDKTTEAPNNNVSITEITDNTSFIEDEIFNHHNKYKRANGLHDAL